jgi:hypothetical protein
LHLQVEREVAANREQDAVLDVCLPAFGLWKGRGSTPQTSSSSSNYDGDDDDDDDDGEEESGGLTSFTSIVIILTRGCKVVH